jgi:hypothetical protein
LFVVAPPSIRFSRLQDRYRNFTAFTEADEHPVESHIDWLGSHASAQIDGTLPNGQLFRELGSLVEIFRERSHT